MFIEDPSLTLSSSALCCFTISSRDQVAGCRSANVALRAFWPSKATGGEEVCFLGKLAPGQRSRREIALCLWADPDANTS